MYSSVREDHVVQGPVQPTVGDPDSAEGLDQMTHRGPFQSLLFCDSAGVLLRVLVTWTLELC